MVCPNCGNNIEDGLKFCTECGHKLDNASLALPVSPADMPLPPPPSPVPDGKRRGMKKAKIKKPFSSKPKWYRFMIWFSILGMALFGAVDGVVHLLSGLPKSIEDCADIASYETLCTIFGVTLIVCAVLSALTWFILVIRSWIVPYTTSVTCLLISLVNVGIYFISKWKIKEIFDSQTFYYTERLILAGVFLVLAVFNFIYFRVKKNIIGEKFRDVRPLKH